MADKAFERTIINVHERPVSPDVNQLQSQIDRAVRDALRNMFTTDADDVVTGFLGGSLKVKAQSPAAMAVDIDPGVGFIDDPTDVPTAIGGISGLDDLARLKPLVLNAVQAVSIDAAPTAGQSRYDIIEVKVDRRVENPSTRKVLDTGTGLFVDTLVNKTLSFSLDARTGRVVAPASSTTGIGYKVGVAATSGSEAIPATTSGYVKIATIHVVGGVTTILDAVIVDDRVQLPSMAGEAVLRANGDASTLASAEAYTESYAFVVAGKVSSAGSILQQDGTVTASASRSSTGLYYVTVAGLTDNAIIVATPNSTGAHINAQPNYTGHSGQIRVVTYDYTGASADSDFSFVVVRL